MVQTVISLARCEADYFEAPAPGWTWGCRFSFDYLMDMLPGAGWRVVMTEENRLLGNKRPEDGGSVYLLCEPAREGREVTHTQIHDGSQR